VIMLIIDSFSCPYALHGSAFHDDYYAPYIHTTLHHFISIVRYASRVIIIIIIITIVTYYCYYSKSSHEETSE